MVNRNIVLLSNKKMMHQRIKKTIYFKTLGFGSNNKTAKRHLLAYHGEQAPHWHLC